MLRSACNPCLPPRSIRKSAESGIRPDSLNSCANISGSITLVRSLLRDGLLDELRLQLFPVVVGSGMRMFGDSGQQLSLKLAESLSFGTGVVNRDWAA